MSVKLYGLAGSPNVRGAMLGLAEKGVDYDLVDVAPPFKSPEHLERNPLGRIPVLEHDGFMLYETQAILRYVDRVFPGPSLQPVSPQEAARVDQILTVIDSYLYQSWSSAIGFERHIAMQYFGRPVDLEQIKAAVPVARGCAEAVEALISGPYLAGETYSLADIRLMPHFDWFRLTPEGKTILTGKGKLVQWFEHVRERPSAKEVLQQIYQQVE